MVYFSSENSGTDGTMPVTLPEWIEGVVFIEEDGAKRILWDIPSGSGGSGLTGMVVLLYTLLKVCSPRREVLTVGDALAKNFCVI